MLGYDINNIKDSSFTPSANESEFNCSEQFLCMNVDGNNPAARNPSIFVPVDQSARRCHLDINCFLDQQVRDISDLKECPDLKATWACFLSQNSDWPEMSLTTIAVLYLAGLSEDIQRVCHQYNMSVAFRSGCSLQSMLTWVKDPLPQDLQSKVTLRFLTHVGEHTLVGQSETWRLDSRNTEMHRSGNPLISQPKAQYMAETVTALSSGKKPWC